MDAWWMMFFTWDLTIRDSGTKCFGFCFAIDLSCPSPGFRHRTKQQSAELRPPSPHCSASASGEVTKHPQPLDQWSTSLDQNSCKLQQKNSQESQQVWEKFVNGQRETFLKMSKHLWSQTEGNSQTTKKPMLWPSRSHRYCYCQRWQLFCLRRNYSCWVTFELFITFTVLKEELVARIHS